MGTEFRGKVGFFKKEESSDSEDLRLRRPKHKKRDSAIIDKQEEMSAAESRISPNLEDHQMSQTPQRGAFFI